MFWKKAVTVLEEKPRDFLAELHEADAALAKANAAIDVFRQKNYAIHDGRMLLVAENIGVRNALDREAFQLCRDRDHAMAEFQSALRSWVQLNGKTGGNKNAGQQSVSRR